MMLLVLSGCSVSTSSSVSTTVTTDSGSTTTTTMVENEASAHVLEKADFIRTARYVEEDWGFPEPAIVDKWFC